MSVYLKQGVLGHLKRPARKALGQVAWLYHKKGLNLLVTSMCDGDHLAGSLHYDGAAFDIEKQGVSIQEIRRVCGKGFDVVDYGAINGIVHIEYDPKS